MSQAGRSGQLGSNDEIVELHLRRVMASWGLVADVGFADLLLVRPTGNGDWKVMGQVRPTTGQTLYPDDLVGSTITSAERPLLVDASLSGHAQEANVYALGSGQAARTVAIPVRISDSQQVNDQRVEQPIAILLREEAMETGRRRGQLERTYLGIFDRLAAMISAGLFPFDEAFDPRDAPRVGDGVALLDADQRIRYLSPNATSALHRLGVQVNVDGRTLADIGLDGSVAADAWTRRHPVNSEIEHLAAPSTVVVVHCIPLLSDERSVTGAVLLLRDVSDIRRRDRMLHSKDATIREVHHRVKNNLQTISALLRMQGRRLESEEAKQAIEESVRRIRSIALVHETLSQEFRELVPFDDLIRPLMRIVEEGLQGDDRPVRFSVVGDAGSLPAEIATPLAVVVVELLQNAVEHAYPARTGGDVAITFAHRATTLLVTVRDHGSGFPEGFSLSTTRSLGLTIVRTLISSELGGVIATHNDGGAVVELRIPLTKTA